MRAAIFHGPHDVRIESVPDPVAPAPGEVVLEVIRAAICGTDAAEWDHGPVLCRPGVVLGHEFVGRAIGLGDDVDDARLSTARALGAGETANAGGKDLAELLLELTDGVGFDIVIEASGAPHAPAAAIAGARRGGRVLLVGLHGAPRPLELTPMILREVDIFT